MAHRHLPRLRSALALGVLLCCSPDRQRSGNPTAVLDSGRQDAGGEPAVVDAGADAPRPSFAQVLGTGVESCEGSAASDIPVAILPTEIVTTLRFIGSSCETLPSSMLLRNLADSAIRIDGLSITETGFSLASAELPLELAPGESSSSPFSTHLIRPE